MTSKLRTENAKHEAVVLTVAHGNGDHVNHWVKQHAGAWLSPRGAEAPIVNLIKAWLNYADKHEEDLGSSIGEDYYLGDRWADIGFALRDLLNGELGRLDGGTLDGLICGALDAEGWDTDLQDRKA